MPIRVLFVLMCALCVLMHLRLKHTAPRLPTEALRLFASPEKSERRLAWAALAAWEPARLWTSGSRLTLYHARANTAPGKGRRAEGRGATQNTTPTAESKRRRRWCGGKAVRPVALALHAEDRELTLIAALDTPLFSRHHFAGDAACSSTAWRCAATWSRSHPCSWG
jgi:hypothetical protein